MTTSRVCGSGLPTSTTRGPAIEVLEPEDPARTDEANGGVGSEPLGDRRQDLFRVVGVGRIRPEELRRRRIALARPSQTAGRLDNRPGAPIERINITSSGDRMEPSREIEELVISWFASASRGDASIIDRHVSPDPAASLIGSDPEELIEGGEEVSRFLHGEVSGAAGNVTFTPRDIRAFSEGTVGWATTLLTITLPDGRRVSPRWSAVVHREEGVWRFVQTHASIGVPNDQIGWVYPD